MNRLTILGAALVILACQFSALAQPGPRAQGGPAGPAPALTGAMLKMFGDHKAFSGDMLTQVKDSGTGQSMEMPGKISFLNGKARLEMDMTQAKGSAIPPQAAAQMKMMGLGEMVMLTLPEKKESYLIYPGLKSYLALPSDESEAGNAEDDLKVETTELGKEKIADHPAIKNKVVVTDGKNNKTEMIVWNATDLKNFPLRIQYTEDGRDSISTYTNIKFEKPAESLFTLPEGYTRYEDMGGLMRGAMQRLMANPPNQPGKN